MKKVNYYPYNFDNKINYIKRLLMKHYYVIKYRFIEYKKYFIYNLILMK